MWWTCSPLVANNLLRVIVQISARYWKIWNFKLGIWNYSSLISCSAGNLFILFSYFDINFVLQTNSLGCSLSFVCFLIRPWIVVNWIAASVDGKFWPHLSTSGPIDRKNELIWIVTSGRTVQQLAPRWSVFGADCCTNLVLVVLDAVELEFTVAVTTTHHSHPWKTLPLALS